MIRSLRLQNFRRHEQTELRFDDGAQLVLIAGNNGSGKSTLLEAIVFALYGEGRQGKRNLDALVRWGAELEGLEVEMSFVLDDTEYRVLRKRVNKTATAVLYGNGAALVEGAVQVTDEITRLLGLDAAGFRLAVIAQQKELDGLASLTPRRRAEMLSRLLRLDALAVARAKARSAYNQELAVVNSIPSEDVDGYDTAVVIAEAELEAAQGAVDSTLEVVEKLTEQLHGHDGVSRAYQAAMNAYARAEGALNAAGTDLEQLLSERDASVLADEPATPSGPAEAEVVARLTETERFIAQAESINTLIAQRAAVEDQRAQVRRRLDDAQRKIAEGDSASLLTAVRAGEERVETARHELAGAGSAVEKATAAHADAAARLGVAERTAAAATELGASCERCGQVVDETHRRRQQRESRNAANSARKAVAEAGAALHEAQLRRERAAVELRTAETELSRLRERLSSARATEEAIVDFETRLRTYDAQLDRLPGEPADLTSLLTHRAELTAELATWRAWSQQHAQWAQQKAAHDSLLLRVDTARARTSSLQQALNDAAPDDALVAQYQRNTELLAHREAESELLAHCRGQLAVARERRENALVARERARRLVASRTEHVTAATTAANAARLLGDVEDRLSTQIRPALEGAVSELLVRLSEGRFSSVRLSEEYDVSVADDGEYRPLSEFSGGEIDLIALAMRLSLAGVVAERHGGGPGFLILDECLGSQDAVRRESILTALRTLRGTYGQILLISHVPGLEDAADLVVTVDTDSSDEGARVAAVSTN